MPYEPTTRKITMEITTPLGKDLLFHRMTAREELGRLFEYEVDLLSLKRGIAFKDILGKNAVVRLELTNNEDRYFSGFVTRFAQTGMHGRYYVYHASLRPWLWFLTRRAGCRIFQKMSVPDILKKIFDEHNISDTQFDLQGTYEPREYCVQYRETDFNFVSRLMEQEGLYYFFKHTADRHSLVVTDASGTHTAFPGHDKIPFIPINEDGAAPESIWEWTVAHEVQPDKYVMGDFNFEAPNFDCTVSRPAEREEGKFGYEVYDYPGEYVIPGPNTGKTTSEGARYARVRTQEIDSQFEVAQAVTNCRGVSTGSIFELDEHPRKDQNQKYLIVAATYDLEYSEYEAMEDSGSDYHCTFKSIRSLQQFRAPRVTPKPIVQGPQTAIVVGPAGEEIHVDKYGRVKLQFHWDRDGKYDDKSSCWVRVSQNWAGKRWGAMFLPRIEQEVIVDFLEGDPDQPIITGRVYNGESMPPYALPAEKTKTTVKTYSSKGGGGFNELRFEDKKGSEQIFIHAEKDQDNRVKNDSLEWIGQDRHLIVVKDQFEKVEKGDKHLTLTEGNQNEEIKGTVSLKTGADLQQKVGAKHALDAGQEIHLKAGMKVVVEAGTEITLKVGGNFVKIDPAGVTIVGTMVLINSGGAAGSGSGCSPEAPKPPKEADTAVPGEKPEAPPAKKPSEQIQPLSFISAQATSLKEASLSGVPFCEKCEEARQAREAQGA